jgi:hypothetical protein
MLTTARLLAWYTKGGFVDEAGVTRTSGFFYNITHWVRKAQTKVK